MSSFTEKGDPGSLRAGPQGGTPDRSDIPLNNNWEECLDTVHGSLRGGGRGNLVGDFTKGRGAGRSFDLSYPIPGSAFASNGAPGDAYIRQGHHRSILVSRGQSPATSATAYYKGRVAVHYSSFSGIASNGFPIIHPVQEANGPEDAGDFACWRAKAIFAFDALGGGDTGLWFTHADDSVNFQVGTARGFAIRPVGPNTIRFYGRSAIGAGFQTSDDLDIVVDTTEYNVYEARWINGTETSPPMVKVYINGALVNSYGYDFLPTGPLIVNCGSQGGGSCYLPFGGLNIAAARDEASLL